MLNIIGAFWEIWLDIVLNTKFFLILIEHLFSDPPANFQAIAKKIKISEKSANYQPNAQYQPKKRLYLYNNDLKNWDIWLHLLWEPAVALHNCT